MKKNKGQFLIEMMVSVSLIVIGMLGVFAVLSQSLALNRIAANQYTAAHLASEGIELTKNILDKNIIIPGTPWNLGFDNKTYRVQFNSANLIRVPVDQERQPYLRFNTGVSRYGYNPAWNQTGFKREIVVENVDSTEIKVTSRVYWEDRGGIDYEVVVEDRFRNWRVIPK